MSSASSPFDWITPELNRLRTEGLLRVRRTVRPLETAWCEIDGQRVRNFSGNDYLNLASDPRVIEAACEAARDSGAGASASALVSGRTHWHAALEERLASFEQQPSAVLFPSGYAANVGTISSLAGAGDIVFCDRMNHASLVDGCRLSGAKLRVYRHDDLAGLERMLVQGPAARRKAIVTDSVFSMDGDLAPLPQLCDLAERFGAMLIVDEAHGTGVFGANGRGVAELQHVEHRAMVRVGTLSKALGSLGGFVAGPIELCEWLWTTSRTQMFSTALPPSACAAAARALDLVAAEPWRRDRLHQNAAELAVALRGIGLEVPETALGPIIPVIIGQPEACVDLARKLLIKGFLVGAIRPPSVPHGTSRLRITVSTAHGEQDIADLVDAIARCGPEMCAAPAGH